MAYLAKRFRSIIEECGPEAVAFYGSGQLTTEEYYIANKLAKGLLGTNNFDTNSRLCMASAVAGYKMSLGSDGPPASYADIDEANCLFLIGTNTADCHPVIFKRIKERKQALQKE
jgi:anaerobic selenocysteine-containing dehydrogenase